MRYLIIGSGFAGAATAYHLVRMGAEGVLILEREGEVGRNSSGLNAAMITQSGGGAAEEALARRGAGFIREPPADWPKPLRFAAIGSLFLASGGRLAERRGVAERARAAGLEAEVAERAWAVERIPLLEGTPFEGALWIPSDGVVDIQALLEGYLEGARAGGAELRLGCEVTGVEVREGRVAAVRTAAGRIACECLVNAAGGWAGTVAAMAGTAPLPLRPCRRHLFRTRPLAEVAADWPLVWDLDAEYYFRPEGEGLLLSPCDQEEHPAAFPEVDPAARGRLLEKLRERVPPLQWLRFEAAWACLRTLTPDGRFVVGWDPAVAGFFWVAGLGGHGATCSAAVGEMAAHLILGRPEPLGVAEHFRPARLLPAGG